MASNMKVECIYKDNSKEICAVEHVSNWISSALHKAPLAACNTWNIQVGIQSKQNVKNKKGFVVQWN